MTIFENCWTESPFRANLLFGRTSFSGMFKVVLSDPPFRVKPYSGHVSFWCVHTSFCPVASRTTTNSSSQYFATIAYSPERLLLSSCASFAVATFGSHWSLAPTSYNPLPRGLAEGEPRNAMWAVTSGSTRKISQTACDRLKNMINVCVQ